MTNPLTVLFWAGAFGSLLASRAIEGEVDIFLFAAGCILATLIFLSAVALIGHGLRNILRPPLIKRLGMAVGVVLMACGLLLAGRILVL
ncbi:LysE family transporter [Brevibacillus borstelensis]|uniref:LysE family transporter n=1 Tax=Brevibacillus borstelensis TaxID=45462 RepID=UPI0030BAA4C1